MKKNRLICAAFLLGVAVSIAAPIFGQGEMRRIPEGLWRLVSSGIQTDRPVGIGASALVAGADLTLDTLGLRDNAGTLEYWDLGGGAWTPVAAAGAGTGDVVGPAGATGDRIAVFNGATGKLLKDGGVAVAGLATAGHDHAATYLGISAKAADSDLLDSHDTAYFAVAGHNHDTAYANINGDAKIGATVTMSDNATPDDSSDHYLLYDPNGSDRDVTLWTPGAGRTPPRVIKHDGAANNLVVKAPGGATLATLTTTDPIVTVVWNGSAWKVF